MTTVLYTFALLAAAVSNIWLVAVPIHRSMAVFQAAPRRPADSPFWIPPFGHEISTLRSIRTLAVGAAVLALVEVAAGTAGGHYLIGSVISVCCFNLTNLITARPTTRHAAEIQYRLKVRQRVLYFLVDEDRPGDFDTNGQIVEFYRDRGIDPTFQLGSLNVVVQTLVDDGLVERVHVGRDVVQITDAGRAYVQVQRTTERAA